MSLKKSLFMLNKFYHDLFVKVDPYQISVDLQSGKLGEYYFLFEETPAKLNRLITGFDDDGIPVNSAYVDVENGKVHYYPISIGQFGLAVYNTYVSTDSPEKKEYFLRIADWFYNNRTIDEVSGAYWLTDIPKPEYKITVPWKSAFTQSRAISILLRAWQLTNDNKYLIAATKALIPFTKDINDGGVAAFTQHGKFYEEYVASEPTMVLDGHIFSMLGLYDYFRAVPELVDGENKKLAIELFNEGVNSLINWLPEYDMGYWLKFNMCRMEHYPEIDPCTIGYLRLVLLQLELLYRITAREELFKFKSKFGQYDTITNKLKMYPVKYKALKKLDRI